MYFKRAKGVSSTEVGINISLGIVTQKDQPTRVTMPSVEVGINTSLIYPTAEIGINTMEDVKEESSPDIKSMKF